MMVRARSHGQGALRSRGLLRHPLWSALLRYSHYLVLSLLGYLVYSAGVVLLADLMQYLLDALGEGEQASRSLVSRSLAGMGLQGGVPTIDSARTVVPVAVLLLVLLRGIGYFMGNYCIAAASRHLMHDFRLRFFQVLLVAPSGYFDRNTPGALVTRLTYTVEQVAGAVTGALRTLLREGLVVVALLAYLFYLNWKLCLIFLAITPIVALIVTRVGKRFRAHSARIQASMGEVAHVAQESISGYRDIRLFGAQSRQAWRFAAASDDNRRQGIRLALLDGLSTPLVQTVLALAIAALVWVALHPAVMGSLSAGALVAFLVAAVQVGKPVRQLTAVQADLQRGLVAADDLYDHFDTAAETDSGHIDTQVIQGKVEISGLSFRYPPEGTLALTNVDLCIESGETVALVGLSGAGKSTLVNLLTRLHSPPANTIRIDGTFVEDFTLAFLREQFAVVSQHPVLFEGTVRENLLLGVTRPVTDTELHQALDSAAALEFVQHLGGLQAWVGSGGEGFSGGQRQRLAIARALLRDAPLLILDESTSALDYAAEHRVQHALQQLMSNRTTLIIAHRLSAIAQAQRIVVLDEGRIVACGTHDELLQREGLYAQLYSGDLSAV